MYGSIATQLQIQSKQQFCRIYHGKIYYIKVNIVNSKDR